MKKLRTAVVGAGKMGKIHAKVYDQLPDSQLVAIVDSDIEKAEKLAKKYNCIPLTDCSELLGKVDAVTIAVPTTYHKQLAQILITEKIAVMIEKPLAANTKNQLEVSRHSGRYSGKALRKRIQCVNQPFLLDNRLIRYYLLH